MVYIPSLSSSLALITVLASAAQAATTCTVATGGDAAKSIASAFEACKNGGTVVFTKGATYNLQSLVEVQNLKNVNVQFYGTINLPGFNSKHAGENSYFRIKGDGIHWDGGKVGTFNGNGQKWWDAENRKAPTVFRIQATNSYFGNFNIVQSPRAHIGITSSNSVKLDGITLKTVSKSSKPAKNTDAVDISNSSNIEFTNSVLTVGDDCTAMNNDVSNVVVKNVKCTGGHGFSIGSLGKGGSSATVKNIRIESSVCDNCQNGIRIKTWPGGKGSVSAVSFKDVKLNNVENPVLITTHYCDKNQQSFCNGNDNHSLTIKDITMQNISGSTSTSKSNPAISINCSKDTPCSGFKMTNVNISTHSKTKKNECINLSGSNSISYCK
ncbi:pectin lyase fold/virulence factor [Choanephora cucurbitarum]|nr:pectin lyase fold/virulence factor [Choanephora cucurbitarum]